MVFKLKQAELEKEDMKLKLANLNHDVSCLISAFNNAKKTGKFEVKLEQTSFPPNTIILINFI